MATECNIGTILCSQKKKMGSIILAALIAHHTPSAGSCGGTVRIDT